jgi:hypothetical protein
MSMYLTLAVVLLLNPLNRPWGYSDGVNGSAYVAIGRETVSFQFGQLNSDLLLIKLFPFPLFPLGYSLFGSSIEDLQSVAMPPIRNHVEVGGHRGQSRRRCVGGRGGRRISGYIPHCYGEPATNARNEHTYQNVGRAFFIEFTGAQKLYGSADRVASCVSPLFYKIGKQNVTRTFVPQIDGNLISSKFFGLAKRKPMLPRPSKNEFTINGEELTVRVVINNAPSGSADHLDSTVCGHRNFFIRVGDDHDRPVYRIGPCIQGKNKSAERFYIDLQWTNTSSVRGACFPCSIKHRTFIFEGVIYRLRRFAE